MNFTEWVHQQMKFQLQYEGNQNPDYFDVVDRVNTFTPYEMVTAISDYLDDLKEKQMPTPRPHYKERIAHAEGYEIQWRFDDQDTWDDIEDPGWCEEYQYRVKPESKPDEEWLYHASKLEVHPTLNNSNLKLTFDGETGALKSAEVIHP